MFSLNRFGGHSLAAALLLGNAQLALGQTTNASATLDQHHAIEEVVVTGQLKKSQAETALPVSVLAGEQLQQQATTNLGETLQSVPGVHAASFGSGVGRPIIRGQSGNRVRVLQGSLNTLDGSAVSPDHANGVSPLAAERVEVVRGPATLLYGNGAVGGVVNLIDNRIPDQRIEKTRAEFSQNHNTNNDQNTSAGLFETGLGAWQLHFDGSYYESNEVRIPGRAQLDEDAEDNTDGFIGNSDTDGSAFTLGTSYVGDTFFTGIAISQQKQNYGLPPGTHGHHDEEHEEDEHEDEIEEEHGEEVDVRIEMEQTRYEWQGQWLLTGVIEQIEAHVAYTDYEHSEIEIELEEHHDDELEEEHEDEEHEEEHHGTEFSHEGFDSRITLSLAPWGPGWSGVAGVHLQQREFGAEGEEAYIAPTDITSNGVFVVQSLDAGPWTFELGARLEQTDTELASNCTQNQTTFSAGASALRAISEDSNVWVSIARAERAATEEELFSNVESSSCTNPDEEQWVEHVATGQIELGNPDLDSEVSHNVEIGWRKHLGVWQAEINLFYNDIADYIYPAFTDDDEVVVYDQEDARFYGGELQFTTHLFKRGDSHLDLTLTGDWVHGKLDQSGNVPRLAPGRVGIALGWVAERWSLQLKGTEVMTQNETAIGESSTDGYTLIQAYGDYHFELADSEWLVFVRGNNLLDEDIRDHTSFIKDAAPAPGIGFDVGARWMF